MQKITYTKYFSMKHHQFEESNMKTQPKIGQCKVKKCTVLWEDYKLWTFTHFYVSSGVDDVESLLIAEFENVYENR